MYSRGQPKPATFIVAEQLVETVQFFVGSSSALKKESIAHFSGFLANCLGCRQNFEGQKM
jgi:hypothetical protein